MIVIKALRIKGQDIFLMSNEILMYLRTFTNLIIP